MKPVVNNEACIGCGTCEGICPEVFKIEEVEGKMVAVVQPADYDSFADKITESIGACPTQAIAQE